MKKRIVTVLSILSIVFCLASTSLAEQSANNNKFDIQTITALRYYLWTHGFNVEISMPKEEAFYMIEHRNFDCTIRTVALGNISPDWLLKKLGGPNSDHPAIVEVREYMDLCKKAFLKDPTNDKYNQYSMNLKDYNNIILRVAIIAAWSHRTDPQCFPSYNGKTYGLYSKEELKAKIAKKKK